MHQYKTATPFQTMSHTILKSSSERTNHYSIIDEISGRLEVYWEQFNQSVRGKSTRLDENKTLYVHPGKYRDATDNQTSVFD